MEQSATDIYTFEKLRRSGFTYVDKTAQLLPLVDMSIGGAVHAEVMTNDGRIDMTCETPAAIWLIEFKLDRGADEALAQIDRNGYAEKFDLASKRVVKIGVAFSSEQRTITDVKVKEDPS